ncbi:MAG TPA: hypothetical protein VJX66_22220 [Amycolatopsis sp.]|nr:hypothetical protein [Amycolatopsis sp.]
MSSPVSDNVRALFVDLEVAAESVDLIIDRFDQWTDNDAPALPSSPSRIVWRGQVDAA